METNKVTEDIQVNHRLLTTNAKTIEKVPEQDVIWEQANPNDKGVQSIGFLNEIAGKNPQIVGYNGIIKGDTVMYQQHLYTVVMVSRLGVFGLSTTAQLPYTVSVKPTEVEKYHN